MSKKPDYEKIGNTIRCPECNGLGEFCNLCGSVDSTCLCLFEGRSFRKCRKCKGLGRIKAEAKGEHE
jgi:hypothetical protein